MFCYFLSQIINAHQSPVQIKDNTKHDVSFSYYTATQIGGVHDGTHYKSVTVVKNIGHQKHDEHESEKSHAEHMKLLNIPMDLFDNIQTFMLSDTKKESKDATKEENDSKTEERKKIVTTSNESMIARGESEPKTSGKLTTNNKESFGALMKDSKSKPHKLIALPTDDDFKLSPIGKLAAEMSARAQQFQFTKNKPR